MNKRTKNKIKVLTVVWEKFIKDKEKGLLNDDVIYIIVGR